MWDVWTTIAADPIAFEPPSAGFALDWHTLAAWRQRGIGFATLTHAAGISSTGDPTLDLRLPFDEPYRIPEHTAAAIKRAKSEGGRIIAIGTTVVRALESAANADGSVRAGDGVASGRIGRETPLRVVDAILTGVHQPGESHFELLRAFANDAVLDQISEAFARARLPPSRVWRFHADRTLLEAARSREAQRIVHSANLPQRSSAGPAQRDAPPRHRPPLLYVVPDRRMSEHPGSARGTPCR